MRIVGFLIYSLIVFLSLLLPGIWQQLDDTVFNSIYFLLGFPIVNIWYVHFQLVFTKNMTGADSVESARDSYMGFFPITAVLIAIFIKGLMIYFGKASLMLSDIFFLIIILSVTFMDLGLIATIQNKIQGLSNQIRGEN